MMEITVKDVLRVTEGKLLAGNENAAIEGFSIDSRTLTFGRTFIAVKGRNFDGHDFIDEAVAKGSAGLIVERLASRTQVMAGGNVIAVEDTRKAMGAIAAELRKKVDIPVICITGTNGKTTIKEMLAHLLSSRYNVLKSRASYNNVIGLGLTLFDLDLSHEAAVLELGTNSPGEIAELAAIAAPRIAIISNIGEGHLESFNDREGVFAEKASLLDFLPQDGIAFLNKDDDLLSHASARGAATRFFGSSSGCDHVLSDIAREGGGYRFRLNGEVFYVPLEGAHNVYNAAAAVAAGARLGLAFDEMRERLKDVSLPSMRLERADVNGVTFLNDSYNANPDSFECALRALEARPADRKGVVAGDMLELGEKARILHRRTGRSVAAKGIDFLITLGDHARDLAQGALEAGMAGENVVCAESHEDAAEKVLAMAGEGTVVLLKGSRGSKMEEVLKCFTTCCTL